MLIITALESTDDDAYSPMQSKIHPTDPSPPQASTRKSGTSRKKLSLGDIKTMRMIIIPQWIFTVYCSMQYVWSEGCYRRFMFFPFSVMGANLKKQKHLFLLISTKAFFDCEASLTFDPKFADSLFVCEVTLSCEQSTEWIKLLNFSLETKK